MPEWPIPELWPLVHIHPWSEESIGSDTKTGFGTALSSLASATYPVANKAFYIPFTVSRPFIVSAFWAANGATANGNFDMGIYDTAGTRLASVGSTAQAGANGMQLVDIADFWLGPGQFYLALSASATTLTFFRGTSGTPERGRARGILEQASAFPLPATATFALVASDYIPLFGLTTRGFV